MRIRGALVVAVLLAGSLVAVPAQSQPGACSASGAVVVGWGGSRYVPVDPQGIGPSCSFFRSNLVSRDVRLRIDAFYAGPGTVGVGGQVIVGADLDGGGTRYFCRGSLEEVIGQDRNAVPVLCSYYIANVGGTAGSRIVTVMYVPEGLVPLSAYTSVDISCSATGEIGILVDILCEEI